MLHIEEYKRYKEEEILPLYRAAGWQRYAGDPALLARAYDHSLKVLAAYSGGRLAGVIRAVGDGCSILYIQDILVEPALRRQGIGMALLKAMLEAYPQVYQTVLLTDDRPETADFYRAACLERAGDRGCTAFFRMAGMEEQGGGQ